MKLNYARILLAMLCTLICCSQRLRPSLGPDRQQLQARARCLLESTHTTILPPTSQSPMAHPALDGMSPG